MYHQHMLPKIRKPILKYTLIKNHYSPALKKGGGMLYRIWVVCHSVCLFVRSSYFFVSAQYLEKYIIESNQILYVHLY